MRPFSYLLCCLPALTASAVRTVGPFHPAELAEVAFLPPVGYVSLIGTGNRASIDPNASVDAGELLRQALFRHDEKLHLQRPLVVADTNARKEIPRNILRVVSFMENRRHTPFSQALPWLDTLLEARHQRYALLSGAWGFTRTAANYRGQLAKDLAVGLVSMGMIVPISYKCQTRVGVAIYDTQIHAIVYYKSNFPAEKDPLEGVVIDRELTDMLAKDFRLTDRI